MTDDIVNFPLQGAISDQLSAALAKCYFEYQSWHQRAAAIEHFVEDAKAAGLELQQERRMRSLWDWAKENGMGFPDPLINAEMLQQAKQKYVADQETASLIGSKLSRSVMLHSACETLYWRLTRFWLAKNRSEAIARHEKKNVTIGDLAKFGSDAVIDNVLEGWWKKHSGETLPYKFEVLIGMYGMPPDTKTKKFDFNKDMLSEFDTARHDAVHQKAELLKKFDLSKFANQLLRFNWALVFHINRVAGIPFDRLAFFGIELDPSSPIAQANRPVPLGPFTPATES